MLISKPYAASVPVEMARAARARRLGCDFDRLAHAHRLGSELDRVARAHRLSREFDRLGRPALPAAAH